MIDAITYFIIQTDDIIGQMKTLKPRTKGLVQGYRNGEQEGQVLTQVLQTLKSIVPRDLWAGTC